MKIILTMLFGLAIAFGLNTWMQNEAKRSTREIEAQGEQRMIEFKRQSEMRLEELRRRDAQLLADVRREAQVRERLQLETAAQEALANFKAAEAARDAEAMVVFHAELQAYINRLQEIQAAD